MANIRIVGMSTVQATSSSQESTQRIELTSSDLCLLCSSTMQKGLLFHKPIQSSQQTLSLVQHLKSSLSRTLDFFFPLAGRLATVQLDDNNAICSYFIDCNNAGAQFVHAIAENVTISDIIEPIYVPSIAHSFFPLTGIPSYEGVSKPLVAVQVTELADGIFIGCTMNHAVADGTTFWNFINSWSEISRGCSLISKPPVFEHWFRSNYCPISFPLSIIKTDVESFTPELILPPIAQRFFHFSKEKIARLKAKANNEVGIENISSLQSILAHTWRSVIRNQEIIDPNQQVNLHVAIGIRTRLLQPPTTREYFGSAIQGGTVTFKAREVIEHGLGYTALQINKMIASFTQDKVRNNIESWIKNPKMTNLRRLPKNDLIASSSPRFNVYGNDFGWGRPIAVRSGPGNKRSGKITLFPGVEEGSMDIEVTIFTEILKAMENDSEFLEAVTI